jgi:hypothetical protein
VHKEAEDEMALLAIHGFLEIFFAGLLGALLLAVGAFALFLALQLIRNPGRAPRHR